jgi:hypothetical protein
MAGKESNHVPPVVQVQELRHLLFSHDLGRRPYQCRNRIAPQFLQELMGYTATLAG